MTRSVPAAARSGLPGAVDTSAALAVALERLNRRSVGDLLRQLVQEVADLSTTAGKCAGCEEKLAAQQKTIDDLARRVADLEKKPRAPSRRARPEKEEAESPAKKKPRPPRKKKPEPPPPDDLTIIEGIGPRISELFASAGITTFAALSATKVADLRRILQEGGRRFATADPSTWPRQARIAATGELDDLAAYQATLTAGRDVR